MSALKPLSWKARRRGKLYCAPACGHGCTWSDYQGALKRAKKCILEMGEDGRGYAPRIWENGGWHTSVTSACGRITVFIHHGAFGNSYSASLCENRWWSSQTDKGVRETPRKAILSALQRALTDLRATQALTDGHDE